LKYQPAGEFLLNKLDGENHDAVIAALQKLETPGLEQTFFKLALDRQTDGTKHGLALNALCDLAATNRARDLMPLLDETVVIVPMPRNPDWAWRLSDHAAVVLARLLEWDQRLARRGTGPAS
jgi:hypothetical protein